MFAGASSMACCIVASSITKLSDRTDAGIAIARVVVLTVSGAVEGAANSVGVTLNDPIVVPLGGVVWFCALNGW